MIVNTIKASSLVELKSTLFAADNKNILALAFASKAINHYELYELLEKKGYIPVTSSTSGQFAGGNVVYEGIVVMLLQAPEGSFKIKRFDYTDNFFEIGEKAGEFAKNAFEESNTLIIANSDADADHEGILKGFIKGSDNSVPIFGGLASRNLRDTKDLDTFIGLDGAVSKRAIGLVVFDKRKVLLEGVVANGWTKIGTPKKITKASGNRVFEIDHKPVKKIYKNYFNFKEDTDLAKYLEYPILLTKENNHQVMRAIVDVDDNSIYYSGVIPENAEVYFCSPNITEAVNRATKDINGFQTENLLMDADAIIAFSCAARVISFSFYIQNELQAFNQMWNEKHVGFFSHGEIGRLGVNSCELHNNSISVVFFKDLTVEKKKHIPSRTLKHTEEKIEIFDFLDKDEIIMKFQEEKRVMSNLLQKTSNELVDAMAELDQYKNHLEKKVEEEISKREEKEKLLMRQSRLAAMGEMIDAVAHQWKQPINIISMKLNILKLKFGKKEMNEEYLDNFQEDINKHLQHMTNTLDEFRTFFRPNKKQAPFDVGAMVEKVLLLVKDELIKNQIEVTVDSKENFFLTGVENEFKHLILNLINNARDAFNEKGIKNRKIQINIFPCKSYKTIEIIDNAGGVPEEIIKDIFKANVTTKEDGKGTGIGLYMSKQIAIKHHGNLSVENVANGAKFIFSQRID